MPIPGSNIPTDLEITSADCDQLLKLAKIVVNLATKLHGIANNPELPYSRRAGALFALGFMLRKYVLISAIHKVRGCDRALPKFPGMTKEEDEWAFLKDFLDK